MARRGRKSSGEKTRKRVVVKLIARQNVGRTVEPYVLMEKLVHEFRTDVKDAKIAMAWRKGWRPDADGVRKLAQCKKCSDLDRELAAFDFVILLNEEAWPHLDETNKRRLIFHELEHAQLSLDSNGEPKRDDRGRLCFRIRKHDYEDFRSVIELFGVATDMSEVVEKAIQDAQRPLLDEQKAGAAQAATPAQA